MSGPAPIDPSAAAPATLRADGLLRPIVDESRSTWICSFCGLLRVYEGGRPAGQSDRNDCRECGARLADSPEDWMVIARHEAGRRRAGILVDGHLL